MKTHNLPEIAALQLTAGATGLTVSIISEAEVVVEHRADDISYLSGLLNRSTRPSAKQSTC